eukprot:GCRY01009228.1.p1 GENE.GCRY01009228.1~~GCRY01009228.1.p1  ORF type:complete len:150 (-),score=18.15 GCRY01009228.1:129-578(-)
METSSTPMRVHVSCSVFDAIRAGYKPSELRKNDILFIERRPIEIKGKGMMRTYWVFHRSRKAQIEAERANMLGVGSETSRTHSIGSLRSEESGTGSAKGRIQSQRSIPKVTSKPSSRQSFSLGSLHSQRLSFVENSAELQQRQPPNTSP